MNTTEIQKKIAYDLTLEFVRENKAFVGTNIPDKVNLFKEYYEQFLKEIKEQKFL